MKFEKVLPMEIEGRSFEIISEELADMGISIPKENEMVVKRAIHTAADFDYAKNLKFSKNVVSMIEERLKKGHVTIITDTNMGKSGVNKKACAKLDIHVDCFMADEDVAELAKKNGTTRAVASMVKASSLEGDVIFAIGNAPTALIELDKLIAENKIKPLLIIAVPVGFVNVVQSKELIMNGSIPYIVAEGRKGGSNVAAAICNALMYEAGGR